MRTHNIVHAVLAGLILTLPGLATQGRAQEMSPQQHFEAGHYNETIQSVPAEAGDDLKYLAAQAHLRLQHQAEARAMFQQLGGGDEANPWTFVGRSGAAQVDGDLGGSEAAARRALEMNGAIAEAHYQLGQALYVASNWGAAAEAFAQASQIAPRHAYAHYYAGRAFYRVKRMDRMARHFEYFLKLAPNAPEAPQVAAVMRTVRGR